MRDHITEAFTLFAKTRADVPPAGIPAVEYGSGAVNARLRILDSGAARRCWRWSARFICVSRAKRMR
jgi:hypothetical protein